MRNGQNKRMRGRNRNHKSHHSSGGGGGGGGGGGHHHNPLTRVYESNGPEVKIRGTAHHIAEKYLQLARDAQGSGDPVTAENHFQHAEHYLRMIAAAQEQFRAQNPYYQAPPAPGEIRDEAFEGSSEDDGGQPGQGQPMQGQPPQNQPNFGSQQPQNFNNSQNYNNNNQQPSYPPREQPQPYAGQQPNSNHYQGRQQHQPQQHQPYNPPPQQFQPAPQPAVAVTDAGQLPSFITGTQPQQSAPAAETNGYDNQSGDRYPRHRRRRHRGPAGPGGPRPDVPNMPQEFHGDDGTDAPGNT
jgi:hypothetical protein